MKTTFLAIVAITVSLTANSQTDGGAQEAPPPSAAPQGQLPPGLEKRDQLPPGLQGREQLPPGLAKRTNQFQSQPLISATNQLRTTNQFGSRTNQFGVTNRFGAVTNATPLTPTGSAGATNRVYTTNSVNFTNQTKVTLQDHAFTQQDRTLLVQVRQAVLPRIQRLATGAWTPAVNFQIREGIVTIVGTVQTIEVRQEIETIVVQTPGVVRVINQLVVGAAQQSLSDADRVLLARVRQTVLPQLQTSGITVPVDFTVQQGVVTLVGTVPTEQRQQIVTFVQQVPGVVQVQ
jgi:osmotically-inducible protein OsmY